jgi:uncharacterized delta-60 repeat protein
LTAGSLDPGFGDMGFATTHLVSGGNSIGESVLVQPDQRIVVGAIYFFNRDGGYGVARFNPDGTPDTTFGTNGQVVTQVFTNNNRDFMKILLQADRKILAVGNGSTFSAMGLVRYNPDGSLDTTFGNGGVVDTQLTFGLAMAPDAILQPDGKIVVIAGGGGRFELVRYNSDGSLDGSYGTSGMLPVGFGDHLALEPDGRLVVAANLSLARYNGDGTLDTTFGTQGIVATNLGNPASSADDDAVAVQADGKIVFAGTTPSNQLALLRYNVNGNLDATFGSGGLTVRPPEQTPYALAIDGQGRILVSGNVFTGAGPYVERFEPNGSFDSSFISSAVATSMTFPRGLAVQADGRVVVAGTHGQPGTTSPTDANVSRLLTDDPLPAANQRFVAQAYFDLLLRSADSGGLSYWVGLLDRQQASREQVALGIESSPEYRAIQVQQAFGLLLNRGASADEVNGYTAFLAAGGTVEQMQSTIAGSPEYFGRLTGGFPLDPSFGTGGIASTHFLPDRTSTGDSVLTQADGRVVLTATTQVNSPQFVSELALARFNSDSSPDSTFGSNGQVLTGLTLTNSVVFPGEAVLQPDQKILVVGPTQGLGSGDIGLARFNPDGTPDTSFGNGGRVDTSIGARTVTHTDVALEPDGRIIVAASIDFGAHVNLLRYNSDGSLDNSFGTGGVLTVPFGGELVVQPDGRFILASNPGLTRYNVNGSVDSTFGQGGTASTTLGPNTEEVAVARAPDGKIVFTGIGDAGQLVVFRFTADGAFDTSFGASGVALFPDLRGPSSIAIDRTGRAVISGDTFGAPAYVIRLTASGAQDTSFGPVGNPGTPLGSPNDVFIDASNNILIAGTVGSAGTQAGAVARLFSDPSASERFPFFLDALYRDALGRAVDPTARSAFQQAFDSGTLTTGQIAAEVFGSTEYLSGLAQTLYHYFLHRDIDSLGFTNVVNALEHGVPDETIIAGIVGSAEYLAVRT